MISTEETPASTVADIETVPAPRRYRQTRFFPPARPLTERFGKEFFRALPREPGVYFMYDGAGKLLYIGQSHDLRERLNSYRHVNSERDARRTVRLVHLVERIEWRVAASAEEAERRERDLLLALRPRFNRASVWPSPKWFIEVRREGTEIELRLTKEGGEAELCLGPFNSGCRHVFGVLARLVCLAVRPSARLNEIPCGLLTNRSRSCFRLPAEFAGGEFAGWVGAFFGGESDGLVGHFQAMLDEKKFESAFAQLYWKAQLAELEEFYQAGRRRGTAEVLVRG